MDHGLEVTRIYSDQDRQPSIRSRLYTKEKIINRFQLSTYRRIPSNVARRDGQSGQRRDGLPNEKLLLPESVFWLCCSQHGNWSCVLHLRQQRTSGHAKEDLDAAMRDLYLELYVVKNCSLSDYI